MKCKFIDIHSHTNNEYDSDIIAIPSYRLATESIPPYMPHIWAGIHPWDADKDICFSDIVKPLANQLVGIGEIGLDYYYNSDNIEQQKAVMIEQMEYARANDLPITIHCVRGFNDIIEALKKIKLNTPVIIHNFIGGEIIAQQLTSMGCYLSYSPASFMSNKSVEALMKTDNSRLFLESDQSGISVKKLYNIVSELKNIELDELKSELFSNFKRCITKCHIG